MLGGSVQIDIKYTKNINLFDKGTLEYNFLNPIWGCLWLNIGILINYKILNLKDIPELQEISKFIRQFINVIPTAGENNIITDESPKPTRMLLDDNINVKDIGKYLGYQLIFLKKAKLIDLIKKYKVGVKYFDLCCKYSKIGGVNEYNIEGNINYTILMSGKKRVKFLNLFPEIKNKINAILKEKEIRFNLLDKNENYINLKDETVLSIINETVTTLLNNELVKLLTMINSELKTNQNVLDINNINFHNKKYSDIKPILNKILEELSSYNSDFETLLNYKNKDKDEPFKVINGMFNYRDKRYYYVILAILWYNCPTKEKYVEYYNGLSEININNPSSIIFNIPPNWDVWQNDKFSNDSLNLILNESDKSYTVANNDSDNKFERMITILLLNNKVPIKIIGYKNAILNKKTIAFPDCGSSSIRDLFRILLKLKSSEYDKVLLDKFGAIASVKTFFELFDDPHQINETVGIDITSIKTLLLKEKRFENKQKLFDTILTNTNENSRNIWGLITSNFDNIRYLHKNGISYEIDKGSTNIKKIINNLFTKIKDWDDIKTIINEHYKTHTIDIEYTGDEYDNVKIITENGVFSYNIVDGHFNISFLGSKQIIPNNGDFDKTELQYIKYLQKSTDVPLTEFNLLNYHFTDNELFITMFNQIKLTNNNIYIKLLDVALEKFIEDEIKRLKCNLQPLMEENYKFKKDFNKTWNKEEYSIQFKNIKITFDDNNNKLINSLTYIEFDGNYYNNLLKKLIILDHSKYHYGGNYIKEFINQNYEEKESFYKTLNILFRFFDIKILQFNNSFIDIFDEPNINSFLIKPINELILNYNLIKNVKVKNLIEKICDKNKEIKLTFYNSGDVIKDIININYFENLKKLKKLHFFCNRTEIDFSELFKNFEELTHLSLGLTMLYIYDVKDLIKILGQLKNLQCLDFILTNFTYERLFSGGAAPDLYPHSPIEYYKRNIYEDPNGKLKLDNKFKRLVSELIKNKTNIIQIKFIYPDLIYKSKYSNWKERLSEFTERTYNKQEMISIEKSRRLQLPANFIKRLEQQRLEQQRLEQQRLKQQRLEQQRLEKSKRLPLAANFFNRPNNSNYTKYLKYKNKYLQLKKLYKEKNNNQL